MSGETLKINEIFFSIQGESTLVGKPTVFVRLALCNLRCRWCDTGYAFWKGDLRTLDEVMTEVRKHPTSYVCLTGGEPLGQKAIYPLMHRLLDERYTVSLETGGGFSVKDVPADVIKVIDLKCPDSGETESMVWENVELALPHDQFKFVIASRADFDWAVDVVLKRSLTGKCTVLFSPVFGKVSYRELAEWILATEISPPVTMQIQIHKEIWGPNQRGV